MTSKNGINKQNGMNEDSFDPKELVGFLKDNFKLISISTVLGLLLSVTYLALTPSQYEATAQIEMAQLPDFSRADGPTSSAGMSISSVRFMIEDPNTLVGRLFLPSSFDDETISACELPAHPLKNEILARSVRASVMKKVTNVAEFAIRHSSADLAVKCATAIFVMIQNQQTKMVDGHIERANSAIANLKEIIVALKDELKRSAGVQSQQVTYLAKREELLLLKSQVLGLEMRLKNTTPARLLSPIFASQKPVFPKRLLTLALGLFLGLILGTFAAVTKRIFQ